MFKLLKKINDRPIPFEFYTAETLWKDKHISKKMLELHLNPDVDPASRNKGFIDKSVDWMTSRFHIGDGFKIADFGCGPGHYTTLFAERGAVVTGIDFSERSIAHAKKLSRLRQLSINYVHQNYLDFKIDRKFDLITLIYCDLCPLSPQQRRRLLATFNRHLKDDGMVFLDVFSLNAYNRRREAAAYEHLLLDGFWSENDYYGFLNTIKYDNEKVILDKYTIVEASKIWEVYNWLQYFSKQSLAKEFEDNGFQIIEYYSDVAGSDVHNDSDVIAVVVKKKI